MIKKITFMFVLLSSFLVANVAKANGHTFTCNFTDGTSWSVTTDNADHTYYYLGVCHGQNGTASPGMVGIR